LTEEGDILEYISRLKNIKQEIVNVGFQAVDDSFMVTILIFGLPSSYTHFLETLQLTGKLEKLKFDELCEILTQHDKTVEKKKKVGEDVFLTEASTSNSSADNSKKKGKDNFNQNQVAQGRGRSQHRGNNSNKGSNSGRNNSQGKGNNKNRGTGQNPGRGKSQNRGQSRGRGQSQGRG